MKNIKIAKLAEDIAAAVTTELETNRKVFDIVNEQTAVLDLANAVMRVVAPGYRLMPVSDVDRNLLGVVAWPDLTTLKESASE
jgi:predicted transcriptional regulator